MRFFYVRPLELKVFETLLKNGVQKHVVNSQNRFKKIQFFRIEFQKNASLLNWPVDLNCLKCSKMAWKFIFSKNLGRLASWVNWHFFVIRFCWIYFEKKWHCLHLRHRKFCFWVVFEGISVARGRGNCPWNGKNENFHKGSPYGFWWGPKIFKKYRFFSFLPILKQLFSYFSF